MKRKSFRRITAAVLSVIIVASGIPAMAEEGEPILPTVVSVSTGAELESTLRAITSGEHIIKLENDIDAVSAATYNGYTTGTVITIDGQGHTIDGKEIMDTGFRFGARGQNGDLIIKNVTFQNMRNDDRYGGGAIALWRGNLTVSGSTFFGNANTNASGNGGGIMLQSNGILSVENSTFVGNSAGGSGGAIHTAMPGTITNVTVVGNTATVAAGGVNVPNGRSGAAPAEVKIFNSIMTGNMAAAEAEGTNPDYLNLIIADEEGNSSNIVGAGDTSSWLAAELAANDGTTATLALLDVEDSPAVNKGDVSTALPVDQRGVARDSAPDIGAYELVQTIIPIPKTNQIGLSQAAACAGSVAVDLNASMLADKVNLIEAVLKYDAAKFDVNVVAPVEDALLNRVVVDDAKGNINILIGVKNEEVIAAEDVQKIAGIVLTPKNGEKPAAASVTVASSSVYAKGETVIYTVAPESVYLRFTYTPPTDVNEDGEITGADLSLALYSFGTVSTDANWAEAKKADVNQDNIVDMADITAIVNVLYA